MDLVLVFRQKWSTSQIVPRLNGLSMVPLSQIFKIIHILTVCDTSTGQLAMASIILFWSVHSVMYRPWWPELDLVSQSAICFIKNTNSTRMQLTAFIFTFFWSECTLICMISIAFTCCLLLAKVGPVTFCFVGQVLATLARTSWKECPTLALSC